MFNIRNIGKTLLTRTQGTKIASDDLKSRMFEMSLADLQKDKTALRNFKVITEDLQGKNCPTNFHGMELTWDKMCSVVKKWRTMIDTQGDVKTGDGYLLVSSVLVSPKNATTRNARPPVHRSRR